MAYFVTGATGFIGRHLVECLLLREGDIYVLVRKDSQPRLQALIESWGPEAEKRIKPVIGDLYEPRLGVSARKAGAIKRVGIDHFFHLAAIYDMSAGAEANQLANVEGTRHAVELAESLDAGCLHHTSSIAVAGMYKGLFREDMFDEGQKLDHPYHRTKFEAERIVRAQTAVPWRVYRPSIVVGNSQDRRDGQDRRALLLLHTDQDGPALPAGLVSAGRAGARVYQHRPGRLRRRRDGRDRTPAGAGRPGVPPDQPEVPTLWRAAQHHCQGSPCAAALVAGRYAPAGRAPEGRVLDADGAAAGTQYPCRVARRRRHSRGGPRIRRADRPLRRPRCRARAGRQRDLGPPVETYADKLWDYWERNLDPDLFKDRSFEGAINGKTVLITGASSGIGKAAAHKIARAGGVVILVARGVEQLEAARTEIEAAGGVAYAYPADLSSLTSIEALCERVLAEHDGVDVIVNNAGRSIRRSIALSYDRFHDFERTIQLNYLGAIKLIMGFLPQMRERRAGHVINVSSIGVQVNPPRFSAYVASKAALDAWTRVVASECIGDNVHFTTIHMPLVRTPMIAPTKMYDSFPTISSEEAAEMICEAIRTRPKQINTRLGTFGEVSYALFPKAVDQILSTAYKVFPDSAAARGETDPNEHASTEQVALANLMKGVHW